MKEDKRILEQNKNSWDAMAHHWFGTTSLPEYGELIPDEDELQLFPQSLAHKKVLEIGCGSGHSLVWCGNRGAKELWGVDISDKQIENATDYLAQKEFNARLFQSSMESDCGLPKDYFDVIYSIYALGWSTNLKETVKLLASYLKIGGVLIFSWDHPLMHCIDLQDEKLIFSGSYLEDDIFQYNQKGKYPVTVQNHKMSSWINSLAEAGLMIERLVEETNKEILQQEQTFSAEYYSPFKAKQIPLSFVIKARKV